jgi:hypothetical protein
MKNSDAGESPKGKNTTFTTRRMFDNKNNALSSIATLHRPQPTFLHITCSYLKQSQRVQRFIKYIVAKFGYDFEI